MAAIAAAAAVVAVIVIIAAAVSGSGGGLQPIETAVTLNTSAPPSTTAATTAASAVETETETSAETTTAVTTTTAETTTTAATTTAATVPLITEDLVIEPADHVSAMGREISCSFRLSDQGVSAAELGDGMKIVAEYTGQSASMSNNPVIMIVTAGETEVEFIPDETSETGVVFYYSGVRRNLVDILGFSTEDIDEFSFRSNGAPVDVGKITIVVE